MPGTVTKRTLLTGLARPILFPPSVLPVKRPCGRHKSPMRLSTHGECGYSAWDAVVRDLRDGHIILDIPGFSISCEGADVECDICVEGYRFTSIVRLNRYLLSE